MLLKSLISKIMFIVLLFFFDKPCHSTNFMQAENDRQLKEYIKKSWQQTKENVAEGILYSAGAAVLAGTLITVYHQKDPVRPEYINITFSMKNEATDEHWQQFLRSN